MFSQQNELKLAVVSLKEVQESLKTKIVDSPEKLKNYKEKMKDTVQKLKNSRVSFLLHVKMLCVLSAAPAWWELIPTPWRPHFAARCGRRETQDPRCLLEGAAES